MKNVLKLLSNVYNKVSKQLKQLHYIDQTFCWYQFCALHLQITDWNWVQIFSDVLIVNHTDFVNTIQFKRMYRNIPFF